MIFNDTNTDNFDDWEFSTFITEFKNNELSPKYSKFYVIFLGTKFSKSNIKPNLKGIEMRGIIFRSKEYINYIK